MEDLIENKVVKTSTGSGAVSLVIVSLAASLSGPMDCYGFEENELCNLSHEAFKAQNKPLEYDESTERLTLYTNEEYGRFESDINSTHFISSDDSLIFELSQDFENTQVDLDEEIQNALTNYSSSLGSDKPSKERW